MKKRTFSIFAMICIFLMSTLFSFAAEPAVTIISPSFSSSSRIVYCDNLLISIKVAQGNQLNISLLSDSTGVIEKNKGTLIYGPEKFTSKNQLNFFTTQINNVKPGIYWLCIDILDANGNVTSTMDPYYFIVQGSKAKKPADASELFNTPNSNTLNFFQSVFKNLFGNEATDLHYGVNDNDKTL